MNREEVEPGCLVYDSDYGLHGLVIEVDGDGDMQILFGGDFVSYSNADDPAITVVGRG